MTIFGSCMPTAFQYCSDLHLEFPLNEQFMRKYPIEVSGDVLLLAGDVVPFAVMEQHSDFFDFCADNFEMTYWVPGNHEYYHSDIGQRSGVVHEFIKPNVVLANNVSVEHKGVQLILATLWSKIDPVYEWDMQRAMSDFHVIRDSGNRFSIRAFNRLHEKGLAFVKRAVADAQAQEKIVVTHHVPTLMHYPQQYVGSVLNQAFAIELYDFIEPSGIHSWIYGHHHTNTPAFKIGATDMLTNQLGYVKHGEHRTYSRSRVIAIGQ